MARKTKADLEQELSRVTRARNYYERQFDRLDDENLELKEQNHYLFYVAFVSLILWVLVLLLYFKLLM